MIPENAKQLDDEVRVSTIRLINDQCKKCSSPLIVKYITTPSKAGARYDGMGTYGGWDIQLIRPIPFDADATNYAMAYILRGQIYSVEASIALRLSCDPSSADGMDITSESEWFFDIRDPEFAAKVASCAVAVMYNDTLYQMVRYKSSALLRSFISGCIRFRKLLRKWRII